MSLRIGILLSGRHGRGSNMQAVADACHDGRIDGRIVVAIGNYAESPALERARGQGIPAATVASPRGERTAASEADYAAALLSALTDAKVDTVLLAGYMLKIPDPVVTAYAGRIMNIHNALLPSFGGKGMYGEHVHKAVLAYGVKVSGCTVHFVDNGYDTGPIILQKTVPVLDDDDWQTLAARVLTVEHQAYPEAVGLLAQGRLAVEGRRVRVLEASGADADSESPDHQAKADKSNLFTRFKEGMIGKPLGE